MALFAKNFIVYFDKKKTIRQRITERILPGPESNMKYHVGLSRPTGIPIRPTKKSSTAHKYCIETITKQGVYDRYGLKESARNCSRCIKKILSCPFMQCCGSGMIYSGSGSSYEFSEFRIQIKAKVPLPCGSRSNPY